MARTEITVEEREAKIQAGKVGLLPDMRKLGLNAKGLIGGMAAWSFLYETTMVVDDPDEVKMKELETGKNLCGMAEHQG